MLKTRGGGRRIVTVAMLTAVVTFLGTGPAQAGHGVTAVTGSAYGYRAFNISFFGGSSPDTGPSPSVTLASNASNSPQNASVSSGLVVYGPAYLFTSDSISVSSSGSLGRNGSVTSSTSTNNINQSTQQPTVTGSEILTAGNIASTCTKSAASTSGSTSITSGTLQTDSGWDDGDLLYPEPGEHDPVNITLPATPAVNTTHYGHIHLSATSTDNWKLVFNEHVTSGNTLTVNGVHEYYGVTQSGNDPNSVLHGDLIIGQAVCGLTVH